jgi:hypothetical protein
MDRSSRRRILKVEKLLSKAEEIASSSAAKKREEPEDPIGEEMRSLILNRRIRDHATAVAAILFFGELKRSIPVLFMILLMATLGIMKLRTSRK